MAGLDPAVSGQQPDPTVHLTETFYVSQFGTNTTGIVTYIAGVQGDPDGNAVTCVMTNINADVIFTRAATRLAAGQYGITFTPEDTDTPGFFTLTWSFDINTIPMSTTTTCQVGAQNPAYDVLPDTMKQIVNNVWIRFADIYDSPNGGPHLQVYFQSNFSRGRIAQLLQIALGQLNTVAQPYTTFSTDPTSNEFPVQMWGSLLEEALYIETLKHLIRSYTEDPMPTGITISTLTRRDYVDRWNTVLQMELTTWKGQLDSFKISLMGLGRARVLVSGGIYGNWYQPNRLPNSAVARGYFGRYF